MHVGPGQGAGGGRDVFPDELLTLCTLCLLTPLMLKDVEDEHLNDSLGNPGLISPDKEDLSRLLVRNATQARPGFFSLFAS